MSSHIIKKVAAGALTAFLAGKAYRFFIRKPVKGRVVLITGGSRGLGLAMARELASRGATLILCARNQATLDKAKQELVEFGARVYTISTDIRNEDAVASMMREGIARFGKIDVVINNAGVMIVGPQNVMSVDDYKEVMDSNLWPSLYTIKAALPYFKKQGSGHFVNICSIGGRIAVPHMLPYSVSKFAMIGLSQGMAAELSRHHVKVTTVVPNLMRTGSPRNITVKGNHQKEYAWFKLSASLPLFTQSAEAAARRIVDAIEESRSELTLTFPAKVVTAMQALLPSVVNRAAILANRFMPDSNDTRSLKGYESESEASRGVIGGITDKKATEFNQH